MNLRIALLALVILLVTAPLALAADGPAGALASARDLLQASRYAEASALAESVIASTGDSDILCGAVDVIISCCLAVGDFDGAVQGAQGLKSRIADPETLTYLDTQIAGIKSKQASYERTIRELEHVLSAHPYDEVGAEAAYKIGATKEFRGRLQEALTAYERVVSDFPTSDWALRSWLDMAAIQQRMAKPNDAEGLYEQVIATAPQSAYAAWAVAGIKDLRVAQGDADGARQRMTEIAARNPNTETSAMAEYCQGELLLILGKLVEGMAALDKVVRERSGTVAAGAAQARIDVIARDLLDKAHRLTGMRQRDDALQKYREVIALAPSSKEALEANEHCGFLAQAEKRYDDAIAQFQAMVEAAATTVPLTPDVQELRAWGMFLLGEVYLTRGEFDQAVTQVNQLKAEHPNSVAVRGAYALLASSYRQKGENGKALAELDAAINRYAGTDVAGAALWDKGQLLRAASRLSEARLAYQRLVNEYGDVWRCQALVESAKAMIRKLDQAAPPSGAGNEVTR